MLESIYNRFVLDNVTGAEALEKSGLKKEDLLVAMNNGDTEAALLLLLGMKLNKRRYYVEDFEDEDTGDIVPINRSVETDELIFSPDPGEMEMLENHVSANLKELSDETLRMYYDLFCHEDSVSRERIPFFIVSELAGRNDGKALEWLGDYYAGSFVTSVLSPADKVKAAEYYRKALDAGLGKADYEFDMMRLKYDVKWNVSLDWVFRNVDDLFVHQEGEEKMSFDDWCQDILFMVWDKKFWIGPFNDYPSEFDTLEELIEHSTIEELKGELLSRGVAESAFHEHGKGVLVDMQNLSYHAERSPVVEGVDLDGVLVVFPVDLFDPTEFYHSLENNIPSAKDCADAMCWFDREYPDLRGAMAQVDDTIAEEKTERERKLPEIEAFLRDTFGEECSEKVKRVGYGYSYGTNDRGYHRYYQESVWVQFFSYNSQGVTLDYYDFLKLPKDFFVWYSNHPDVADLEIRIDHDDETDEEMCSVKYYCDGFIQFKVRLKDLTYALLEQMMENKEYQE